MRSSLSGGKSAWVAMVSVLFLVRAPVVCAQGITPSDVEQYIRAVIAAEDSGDIARIIEVLGNGQVGFGWRTRDPRANSSGDRLSQFRAFLASMEHYRITLDEIHAAVDGDVGLAWGFFTEEFQVRERASERVRVRFTTTIKRDKAGWRQLLYHRDAQPFDQKGNYIPLPLGSSK